MGDINLKEAEIQRKQAIGARIKKIRKDKKTTQNQFAEMIGKSMSSIQKYEDGTTDVPIEVIELMATQLGCTIISIVGETSWSEDHFLNVYGFQPDHNEREIHTLLDNYNKLNNKGRQEALKRIYELTLVPGYGN